MTQQIQHFVQPSWWDLHGRFVSDRMLACEPVPGWSRFGETPGAVMAHAKRIHVHCTDTHPDAQVVKVDILESLVSWDAAGQPKRMYVKRIGQWPAEEDETVTAQEWHLQWMKEHR
jgi:hypothetical protein